MSPPKLTAVSRLLLFFHHVDSNCSHVAFLGRRPKMPRPNQKGSGEARSGEKKRKCLAEDRLQIFLRCGDGFDAKGIDQELKYRRRNKGW